jgi:hypothetical protein
MVSLSKHEGVWDRVYVEDLEAAALELRQLKAGKSKEEIEEAPGYHTDVACAVYEAAWKGDFEPFSYSGRDMYGKECIAVEVESVGKALKVAWQILDFVPLPLSPDVSDSSEFQEMRIDNLGMGYVVYWPDLEWKHSYMESSQ